MNFQSFYNDPRNFLFQNLDIFLLGLLSLIYIIIIIIIALRMIIAYYKFKVTQHLYSAIAFLGAATTSSGIALNFIFVLIFNTIPLLRIHVLLNGGWIAFSNFFWMITIITNSKLRPKLQKYVLIFLAIGSVFIQVFYTSLLTINPNILIYNMITPLYGDYTPFFEQFLLAELIAFVLLGFCMSIMTMKSKNKQIKLKGEILTLSFSLFFIGTIFDIYITESLLFIVGLIFLAISAILFYMGFILPNWIKKLFIKPENES